MEGIFSKNLYQLKNSDTIKYKENIETFIEGNIDSTFSDDYFFLYNHLKNPQSFFFSKALLDEINYVNLNGGDLFGAFTNTEKKINYFIETNKENCRKSSFLSFGIPYLNENIHLNNKANKDLKNKIENVFDKYLTFYPEESNEFSTENQVVENKDKEINNFKNVEDVYMNGECMNKNQFNHHLLIEDDLILALDENEEEQNEKDSKLF